MLQDTRWGNPPCLSACGCPLLGSKTGVTCWEPFGARFCNLAASRPAIKGAFWDYWETAVFEPKPGREPFGARVWQFGGFWKPLGSSWKASGKLPGNRRAAASSARRPENTKAQAFFRERFSQSDASSRTPFLVTLKLYFAFLKLGTSFWQPETCKRSI